MIKIRYSDLPAGLHVRTAVRGRHTILYLLPGLTGPERRAAIHRARSNARVGYGPRLPAVGVACAVVTDRIRTTVGNSLAAVRVHPAFFVPALIVVVSVGVAYLLLASVSIEIRPPRAAGPGGPLGVPFSAGPRYPPTVSRRPARPAAGPAASGRSPGGPGGMAPGQGGGQPGPSPSTRSSPSSSGSPAPTGPGPLPGPSPSPSPAPSPAASGLCVDVGPLGVCLKA